MLPDLISAQPTLSAVGSEKLDEIIAKWVLAEIKPSNTYSELNKTKDATSRHGLASMKKSFTVIEETMNDVESSQLIINDIRQKLTTFLAEM